MGMTVTESDLELIGHLDFAHTPPCEIQWHEEFGHTLPAHYIVDVICFNCQDKVRLLVCEQCYEVAMAAHMWCEACNQDGHARDFWKVVGLA